MSLFGSIAEGRADAWSDIDMIVTTDDLPAAKASVLGLLEELPSAVGEQFPDVRERRDRRHGV